MADGTRDPRAYELMTVFVPDLQEDAGPAQVDRVAGYIASAGGDLTETLTDSPWGRRRLAYTIRFNGIDYRDGLYTVYHFQSAPNAISAIERELKLDTSTMRYLLVHDDPKTHEKFNPNDLHNEAEGTAQGNSSDATSRPGNAAVSAPAGDTLTDDAVAPEADSITAPVAEDASPETQVADAAPAAAVVADEAPEAAPADTATSAPDADSAPAVVTDDTDVAAPATDETPADTGDNAEGSEADKE